jgi:hypothetical protein
MGGMRKPLGASAFSGGATRGAAFIDRAFVLICPIDRFIGYFDGARAGLAPASR